MENGSFWLRKEAEEWRRVFVRVRVSGDFRLVTRRRQAIRILIWLLLLIKLDMLETLEIWSLSISFFSSQI